PRGIEREMIDPAFDARQRDRANRHQRFLRGQQRHPRTEHDTRQDNARHDSLWPTRTEMSARGNVNLWALSSLLYTPLTPITRSSPARACAEIGGMSAVDPSAVEPMAATTTANDAKGVRTCTSVMGSLESQCFDGIETSGLPRRVVPEEDADDG